MNTEDREFEEGDRFEFPLFIVGLILLTISMVALFVWMAHVTR